MTASLIRVPLVLLAVLLATQPCLAQNAPRQQSKRPQQRRAPANTQRRPTVGPIAGPAVRPVVGRHSLAARPPFQMTPAQQEYTDQILRYWEHRSSGVERYRCTFTRWVYDPTFGPKDPRTYKTVSTGAIMYSMPDKGLFRVDTIKHYTRAQQAGAAPQYLQRPGEVGEHWVCDGKSIFEFNSKKKQLIETVLPKSMQGKAISAGPLPFIFGAKIDEMKQRYWIRHDPLDNIKGEYWLEAYPKTAEDRANHKMVLIIIDEKDYLPKAMEIHPPNYVRGRNEARTVFLFENRETNWSETLQRVNLFHREFFQPAVPKGWQKVRQETPLPTQSPSTNNRLQQTRRPTAKRKR